MDTNDIETIKEESIKNDKNKPTKKKFNKKWLFVLIGIVLGAILAVVFVVSNNDKSAQETKEMIEEIKQDETSKIVVGDMSTNDYDCNINLYSKNNEDLDALTIELNSDDKFIDEKKLNLACTAVKLIDGISLDYTNNNHKLTITAQIEQDKISEKTIELVTSLNILGGDTNELLQAIVDGKMNKVVEALGKINFNIGNN